MDHSFEKIVLAENVTKTYDQAVGPILKGVSLSVDRGEFFGLLGPNGAGKTTLISILSGILQPDVGAVSVVGVDVRRHSGHVKRRIGLVTQDVALYEELTGRENFEIFGRLYGLRGARLRERIDECLETTGLAKSVDARISTYSGGMKRLANLVVGILHEPDLLILDEPTVGVDVHSRHRIYECLLRMNREGMSIVYTSHYIEEAEKLCSRIAIIDAGRILASGAPSELISTGGHANLEQVFLQLTKEVRND